MNDILIIIPIGLPGSGKTYYGAHYANNCNRDNSYPMRIIDFDYYMMHCDRMGIDWAFYNETNNGLGDPINVYCDGLFTTDGPVLNIIDSFARRVKTSWSKLVDRIDVKLVYFKEDRAACLLNDTGRRDKSAAPDIRNMPLMSGIHESLLDSISNCMSKYGFSYLLDIEMRDVYKQDKVDVVLHKHDIDNDAFIKSDTMYAFDCGIVDNAATFQEFDDLIRELVPNITLAQYLEIKKNTCQLMCTKEYGYYDSVDVYLYWECNINKLKEEIKNLGINIEYK